METRVEMRQIFKALIKFMKTIIIILFLGITLNSYCQKIDNSPDINMIYKNWLHYQIIHLDTNISSRLDYYFGNSHLIPNIGENYIINLKQIDNSNLNSAYKLYEYSFPVLQTEFYKGSNKIITLKHVGFANSHKDVGLIAYSPEEYRTIFISGEIFLDNFWHLMISNNLPISEQLINYYSLKFYNQFPKELTIKKIRKNYYLKFYSGKKLIEYKIKFINQNPVEIRLK
jgi:hypothetical protein